MSIWILLVVLVALFAALGYVLGAIRAAVTFGGLLLSLLLVHSLAPLGEKILPSIGVKNFVAVWAFAPILMVVLVTLVCFGISFAVHAPYVKKLKMRIDELTWLAFQRMNARLGACLGIIGGLAVFFALGTMVYSLGYATVQLSADNVPGWLSAANTLRLDMEKTGFDRAFASLDKTPPQFYQTADVLGLIYQNPQLQSRIDNYPPFLALLERQEIQDMRGDKEYNELLFSKGNIVAILQNPRTVGLVQNGEIRSELEKTDLNDLETYLKTGKSPKYDDEKILGRWLLDKDALLTHIKKTKPDMRSNELLALKQLMERFPKVTMLATVDNRVIFKVEGKLPDPNAPPPAPAAPAVDPRMAARYGTRGAARPPGPAPAPKPAAPAGQTAAPPVLMLSGEGSWKAFAGEYQLVVPDAGGKQNQVEAKVDQDELIISKGNQTLVFSKIEA